MDPGTYSFELEADADAVYILCHTSYPPVETMYKTLITQNDISADWSLHERVPFPGGTASIIHDRDWKSFELDTWAETFKAKDSHTTGANRQQRVYELVRNLAAHKQCDSADQFVKNEIAKARQTN